MGRPGRSEPTLRGDVVGEEIRTSTLPGLVYGATTMAVLAVKLVAAAAR